VSGITVRIRTGVESGPLGFRSVVRIEGPTTDTFTGQWTTDEAAAEAQAAEGGRRARKVFETGPR
jgi:hypothetical protein